MRFDQVRSPRRASRLCRGSVHGGPARRGGAELRTTVGHAAAERRAPRRQDDLGRTRDPDLAGEERFYAGLFGWTFRDSGAGDAHYALALLDDEPVAGLLQAAVPTGEKRQPFWLHLSRCRQCRYHTARGHGARGRYRARRQDLRAARPSGDLHRPARSGVRGAGLPQRRPAGSARRAGSLDMEFAAHQWIRTTPLPSTRPSWAMNVFDVEG